MVHAHIKRDRIETLGLPDGHNTTPVARGSKGAPTKRLLTATSGSVARRHSAVAEHATVDETNDTAVEVNFSPAHGFDSKDPKDKTRAGDDEKHNIRVGRVVSEKESIHIRIGTLEPKRTRDDTDKQHKTLIVAKVPRPTNKQQTKVLFREVDCWIITDMCIGHYNCGDESDIKYFLAGGTNNLNGIDRIFRSDPQFVSRKDADSLISHLIDIVHDPRINFEAHTSREIAETARGTARDTVHLVTLPTLPAYAAYGEPPPTIEVDDGISDIEAIINFKNNPLDKKGVKLTHTQTTLDYDETDNSLTDYLFKGDGSFPGFSKDTKQSQVEIWVLPLVFSDPQRQKMYCWSSFPDMTAAEWIDSNVVKEYDKKLYMEVYVNPGHAQGSDASDDDNIKVASKKKIKPRPKTKKKAAESVETASDTDSDTDFDAGDEDYLRRGSGRVLRSTRKTKGRK